MSSGQANPKLIMWVIWLFFLSGIPMLVIFLGPKSGPEVSNPFSFPAVIPAIIILSITALIRWVILPKISFSNHEGRLTALILGMALAESMIFLGIFLFPADFSLFLVFTLIGMAQFIPLSINPSRSGHSFAEDN